ncbi:hypothetical protein CW749_09215 [Vibrio sp. vnigr-6D03]|uniref:hypothetical protein n=1 Tax=Vibrio sp. vnigr-6D03 TaxID=2058088 RepID=UPI000C329148|nr:hypothetical protein [Vibrio sp. vnigr-6D03]PKF79869.1 hypothetical protein CW749_09215 [Vibrio sp. vnigr-6D03]
MTKSILPLLLVLPFASATTHASDLCPENQLLIEGCSFGKKSVSVCTASENTILYRYGTAEKIEMEIESPVKMARSSYSGGGAGFVLFENGRYNYIVFSRIMRGERQEDGSFEHISEAGIIVEKDESEIATLMCKTEMMWGKGDFPEHEKLVDFRYY